MRTFAGLAEAFLKGDECDVYVLQGDLFTEEILVDKYPVLKIDGRVHHEERNGDRNSLLMVFGSDFSEYSRLYFELRYTDSGYADIAFKISGSSQHESMYKSHSYFSQGDTYFFACKESLLHMLRERNKGQLWNHDYLIEKVESL